MLIHCGRYAQGPNAMVPCVATGGFDLNKHRSVEEAARLPRAPAQLPPAPPRLSPPIALTPAPPPDTSCRRSASSAGGSGSGCCPRATQGCGPPPPRPRRVATRPRRRRAAVSLADAPRPHRPARPPRAPQAMEAKWSATRFTPFLVPPHHYPPPRRAHLPRLSAHGARALQVLDPDADPQPRAPDTEEYIVRERPPPFPPY